MESAPHLNEIELVLRLLLAAGLGAVIGIEREWRDRTAGLRTHMLVCIGAAAFTIVSAYGFTEWFEAAGRGNGGANYVGDPTRIAAQMVTGIGFLGAGAIFRSDDGVRGLTTAASIWMMAAIGLAAGAGYYELAVASTFVVLVVLVALRQISRRIGGKRRGQEAPLELVVNGPTAIGFVFDSIAKAGGSVSNFTAHTVRREDPARRLTFDMFLPTDASFTDVLGHLAVLDGVDSVSAPHIAYDGPA